MLDRRVERVAGIVFYAAAVLTGAFLRFYDLSLKPLHSDEGVNGWFLMNLYRGLHRSSHWLMNYKYDPANYHGPFLYFAGLIPFFTIGPSNWSLRLLPAIAGTGCLLLLWPIRRWLGWAGLATAAWLMAISPPFLYFSRTAIHEIYVFFFSFAAVVCFVRSYAGSGVPGAPRYRINWMTFGIVSCGFLFTNKETSVITFVAFLLAGLLAWSLSRRNADPDAIDGRFPAAVLAILFTIVLVGPVILLTLAVNRKTLGGWSFALPVVALVVVAVEGFVFWSLRASIAARLRALRLLKPINKEEWSDYGLALAWAAAISIILFTSFFNNLHGAIDMFATYKTWIWRGNEGAGHNKPFFYWVELLREYDAPILWMALAGTVAAAWRRDRFSLFVVVWGWSLWFVYSAINYKTPWCNLNFTGPGCLLGGVAVREVARLLGRRNDVARVALTAFVPLAILVWPVPSGPVLSVEGAKPAHVAWSTFAWDVNFVHYDDDRYKIIYVQTVRDFETLVGRVDRVMKAHGEKTGVWVTSGDYWPMPFYLREYDGAIGYYQGKIPAGTVPPVVVASSTQEAELRPRLEGYREEHFMMRPGVVLTMFVEPAVYDPIFGAPDADQHGLIVPTDLSALVPGLVAEYRYGIGCTGEVLAKRVDSLPKYGASGDKKEFRAPVCATWKGFLRIDDPAEYAFVDSSDDGSWIFVDGELLLDNGGTHGASERTSVLKPFAAGLHALEVRYFDAGGGAALHVGLKKRGGVELDLAPMLVHDRGAETAGSPTPPLPLKASP